MTPYLLAVYRWRRIFVVAISAAALLSVLLHAPVALRLVTVLPALLICPGLALVGAIRLDGPATVLRLAIPVSAAVSLLVAQMLLTTHAFVARAGLGIVCGICLLAVAVDYLHSALKQHA